MSGKTNFRYQPAFYNCKAQNAEKTFIPTAGR